MTQFSFFIRHLADIVQKPGHERFVTTMLAGSGPVPAAMLVVASDDPWMPQAAEHLAALDALGVEHAVVAVTRSDLADPGPAVARAAAEVARTSLAGAPIIEVSGRTGEGLDELRVALAKVLADVPPTDPAAANAVKDAVQAWMGGNASDSFSFSQAPIAAAKPVVLTHKNITAVLASVAPLFKIGRRDSGLSVLPLHQTFELTCGLLLPLLRGAHVTYVDELSAEKLSDAFQAAGITAMIGVPQVWEDTGFTGEGVKVAIIDTDALVIVRYGSDAVGPVRIMAPAFSSLAWYSR